MKVILEILQKIELDKRYIMLCNLYSDFDNSANLGKKDVDPIIKSQDAEFKYIARDRTFMKETSFKEFTVRFFIGFKSGIVDFGYLIWVEGNNQNFYKGNLYTLSKEINEGLEEKIKYNRPIATSISDFEVILEKIFELFDDFKKELSSSRVKD